MDTYCPFQMCLSLGELTVFQIKWYSAIHLVQQYVSIQQTALMCKFIDRYNLN